MKKDADTAREIEPGQTADPVALHERRPCLSRETLRALPTVTVEDAGAVLNLSRAAAYAAAKRGDIPVIRIGRRLLVPTARLLRMLGEEIVVEIPQPKRTLEVQRNFAGPVIVGPDQR